MGRRRRQVALASTKPFPPCQIYMVAGDLAKRYDVTIKTIRRWIASDFLPLEIDSPMKLLRWNIEELKEFEEDVINEIESPHTSDT